MSRESVRRIAEGRNADLVPTPLLSADGFEDFVERLLSAHRFCAEPLVHVTRVERWGRKGDKQDGIDFEGDLSDRASAAWQCKRQDGLSVANVREYVEACTFSADRYFLAFSGEASAEARKEILAHPNWELLDQRGLGRLLQDLPLHKRRQVLDDTWGPQWRRQYLQTPGEDAFLSMDQVLADRVDERNLINDRGVLVGRDRELRALRTALNRERDWPSVVVVAGAGGRGKSRILAQALSESEQGSPQIPILTLGPGRQVDVDALKELPHIPATIFVDDIHRDPDQLIPLLAYQRRVPGTQIVLASRGQGIDPIKSVLFREGRTESQIEIVDIGALSLKDARAMVDDLVDGLTLPRGLAEHLANQAREAPYVAVVALNLARRGELQPGYLRLDDGIRRQVLARYEDVLIGSLHGFDADLVKRFLATVAALGTVDLTDADTQVTIGKFLGIRRTDVLRLAEALAEQGVLAAKEKVSRVVPEVLADQVLENEAIAFGADTGFVSELWATFGDGDDWRLLTNLASLEWRLTSQGLPSVIGPIWNQIHEFIDMASLRTLQAFLGASADLAFSQPVRLMETLLRARRRLDHLTFTPSEVVEDELFVRAWGGRPIEVGDVENLLPKLFAECARNEPSILETALDQIWSLARSDTRPTNQFTEHPRRVIVDSLADIGNLTHPSFPSRIVERVRLWLRTPGAASDAVTPLFPFAALLAKEGSRIRLANRRTIHFEPFLVNVKWAHPFRSEIRSVLVAQGLSEDIRRGAHAVRLLTDTLRSPHGQFGRVVDQEVLESWEADDMDTMAALEAISHGTDSDVLRRTVRRGIEWHALRAPVLAVRERAFRLLVQLDQLDGDDLAETLLPSHFTTVPLQRGAEVEAQSGQDSDPDVDSASAMRRMARDSAVRRTQAIEVADSLWRDGVSEESVGHVIQVLDEIAVTSEDNRDGLAMLFQAVAVERPQYLPDLIGRVEAAQHPGLDRQLHVLLVGLLATDRPAALAHLSSRRTAREAVRLAAARMYNSLEPENRADLHDLREQGAADESEQVRQEYLASMGPDLIASVANTVHTLIGHQAEPQTIERVLFDAWRIDQEWAAELGPGDAALVLKLILASDWSEWMAQHILAKVASLHLALILHSLKASDSLNRISRHNLDQELIEAFRAQPTVVADWIVSEIQAGTDSSKLDSILEIISGESFSPPLGDALATHIPDLSGEQTAELVRSLASSQTWAVNSPALALAILTNARTNGADIYTEIEEEVRYATRPRHWSGSNGVSEELDAALAANEQAAASEADTQLQAIYEQSAKVLRAMIERNRRAFEEDEDDD